MIKRRKMNMSIHRCIHLCLRASKMEIIKFNLQEMADRADNYNDSSGLRRIGMYIYFW